MGSFTGLAQEFEIDCPLRMVDNTVTICFTREEAHEVFERILNSSLDDNFASAQALRKLAGAIATANGE